MEKDLKNLQRAIQPMPKFIALALKAHHLDKAYLQRPPYQRNDYLSWINRAKREDTKQKRLKQMLDELTSEKEYMGMKWKSK